LVPEAVYPGMPQATPTITPALWFDNSSPETNLQAAIAYYLSVFPDARVENAHQYPHSAEPVSATFVLNGQRFFAINGGPQFPFTEAVSFLIECADQTEVDHYWDALTAEGEESQCGWCKDKFGLSWQVVPRRLFDLLADPDPQRAEAAKNTMLTMRRIVLADIEAAADAAASTSPGGG
jgi:predicted 3-demethylubiquinone-9 3-methyltransferase (glyoxalase superfamily)